MTTSEQASIFQAVMRIPCELAVLSYSNPKSASAWTSCKECPRCILRNILRNSHEPWLEIEEFIKRSPVNGGYVAFS